MKTGAFDGLRIAAVILLSAISTVLAQSLGLTEPVGSIKLNVTGTNGSSTASLSFIGLALTRNVEYQGSAETLGVNTLTDNQATWTENQFNGVNGAYFVEIASGPGAGTTYDISATSAANKSLTLVQALAPGVVSPMTFKVRKHWTIGSVFGPANQSGLGGGAQGEADEILILNAGTSLYQSIYYKVGGLGGNGWRNSSTGADATNHVIYPDDGMIIKRRQAASMKVSVLGAIKSGQTSIPIVPGDNLVGNVYAAPMTIASSGLYTGNPATGMAEGNISTADFLLLWNGIGYDAYYYQTSGIGGVGWRKGGDAISNASGTVIPAGTSMILRRKATTGFNWVIPQHPSSL